MMRARVSTIALLALAFLSFLALVAADAGTGAAVELADAMDADLELDALLDEAEAEASAGARNLKSADAGAVEVVPETPEDDAADESDIPASAAVEVVPEPESEPEPEPEPARISPSAAAAAAAAVEPVPDEPAAAAVPEPKAKPKPKPAKATPAPSASPPTPGKVLPKRRKWARANQMPGPCTYCKAAAHRLQTSLHAAHRDHHEDEAAIEEARASRTKLPSHAYAKHVHPACQDKSYWEHYVSFVLEDGNEVLAGGGLDWSTTDLEDVKMTGKDHTKDLIAACERMANEAEEDGLYDTFWKGRLAFTGRKWFFQDAYCMAEGHACAAKHSEL